jgi:hypothetical protein
MFPEGDSEMFSIDIGQSVGINGVNLPSDVFVVGAALVDVGPDRGGVFAPPLELDGLGQAVEGFQRFQGLPVIDGRVDPGGRTLRRFNEILDPETFAAGLTVQPLDPGLATSVESTSWRPVEASLISELVFEWTGVTGKGTISYFQLDEDVVPKWFGVLVPEGVSSFDKIHLFFHPTPAQAGHHDGDYLGLGNWPDIFHYLTDNMGSQFCAAGMDRVLVMPLMTQAAAQDCGIFPQRWESIIGRILGILSTGDMTPTAPLVYVNSLVVSSFSSGIVYSHLFRKKATLGARLAGVIDFDGGISSFSQLSAALSGPPGHVVKMAQIPTNPQSLGTLAANNVFPLTRPRWGGPWTNSFSTDPKKALLEIHTTIPQTMMFIAARRAG